jgi:hypothetical protein
MDEFNVILHKSGYAIPGFFWSTPSIFYNPVSLLITRINNYSISCTGEYLWKSPFIQSRILLSLDEGTTWREVIVVDKSEVVGGNRNKVRGLEDCRLYWDAAQNRVLVTGVLTLFYGCIRLILGVLDYSTTPNPIINRLYVLKSPYNRPCEKNWALFTKPNGDMGCVYQWEPNVEVGVLEKDLLTDLHHIEQSPPFKGMRGSSHALYYKGNQWFVTHTVSMHRYYLHCVVVMDAWCRKIIAHTPLFRFVKGNHPVEFCCGLTYELNSDIFVFGVSVLDSASLIVSIPTSKLISKLVYCQFTADE